MGSPHTDLTPTNLLPLMAAQSHEFIRYRAFYKKEYIDSIVLINRHDFQRDRRAVRMLAWLRLLYVITITRQQDEFDWLE